MRLWVEVSTAAGHVPWDKVLSPGRAVAYQLLTRHAPELARTLHDQGWGRYGMVPFGYSGPVFPAAPRQRGRYTVGGVGWVEFGSPLADVVDAWATAIADTELLDWGGVALRVNRVTVMDPPGYAAGRAQLRTTTPVVLKGDGRGADGERRTRQAWVLPGEPEFAVWFERNLQRKAATLGVSPDVVLDEVTWVGPKRAFSVGNGSKPGASVEVSLSGAPETLQVLWSWGLGQSNSSGFGWVAAA